jgi:hypothetical protein
MEQFSRECLEIDSGTQGRTTDGRPDSIVNTSMDKVYRHAAKLVKTTLDVEGVVVMDVSQCEILEPLNGGGSLSIIMHHGDSQSKTVARSLSLEEYGNLHSFFVKHPEGKISEGIIPFSLRPLLPTHIQYALSNVDRPITLCISSCDMLQAFPFSTSTSDLLPCCVPTTRLINPNVLYD